jgi:hypothetical protein
MADIRAHESRYFCLLPVGTGITKPSIWSITLSPLIVTREAPVPRSRLKADQHLLSLAALITKDDYEVNKNN